MTEDELEDLRTKVARRKKAGATEAEQRVYWKNKYKDRSYQKRKNKMNPNHPDYDYEYHTLNKLYQKKYMDKRNEKYNKPD